VGRSGADKLSGEADKLNLAGLGSVCIGTVVPVDTEYRSCLALHAAVLCLGPSGGVYIHCSWVATG